MGVELLEDDGTVALALMATGHPEVHRRGSIAQQRLATANKLLEECSPWFQPQAPSPDGVLAEEAYLLVQRVLSTAHEDIESLDDIDLSTLQPGWGDKDSVRMARKSLIGFLQAITTRLDQLRDELAKLRTKIKAKAFVEELPTSQSGSKALGQRDRSRSKERARKPEQDDESTEDNENEREKRRDAPHFEWSRSQALGPQGRYIVRKQVGEGTFGRVLSCLDGATKEMVAVKVVKGIKRYHENAEVEADILRQILLSDPGRQSHCVRLLDEFLHPGRHYCLVFEPLDQTLREFLRLNDDRGLLVRDVRLIAQQLLQCLAFLAAIELTHTDLKCRNVMFRDARSDLVPLPRKAGAVTRSPKLCDIVVIDFGGTVTKAERHGQRIGTRQYRAPEAIVGLPWDEKFDVWSVGCILAMLFTGTRLFQTVSVSEEAKDLEHLALMEMILGKLPSAVVRAPAAGLFSQGRLAWPGAAEPNAVANVSRAQSLSDAMPHESLRELLRGLLQLESSKRLAAESALRLPFVTSEKVLE